MQLTETLRSDCYNKKMHCRGTSYSTVLGDNLVESSFPKFVSKLGVAVVSRCLKRHCTLRTFLIAY